MHTENNAATDTTEVVSETTTPTVEPTTPAPTKPKAASKPKAKAATKAKPKATTAKAKPAKPKPKAKAAGPDILGLLVKTLAGSDEPMPTRALYEAVAIKAKTTAKTVEWVVWAEAKKPDGQIVKPKRGFAALRKEA